MHSWRHFSRYILLWMKCVRYCVRKSKHCNLYKVSGPKYCSHFIFTSFCSLRRKKHTPLLKLWCCFSWPTWWWKKALEGHIEMISKPIYAWKKNVLWMRTIIAMKLKTAVALLARIGNFGCQKSLGEVKRVLERYFELLGSNYSLSMHQENYIARSCH